MNARTRITSVLVSSLAVVPLLVATGQDNSHNRADRPDSSEAPAGFDNQTNGYLSQKLFDDFRTTFEDVETIEDGLGPTFNDSSCASCHNIPVTGGSGQKRETRAGTSRRGRFTEHAGGSLIQDQLISTCPANLKEAVAPGEDQTFRSSLNVLGDGFIEAIDDETIIQIAKQQPREMQGLVIRVPVLEANGALRVARFGWKNQHASLESFAADAYLNEMGITSPLQPNENTADGHSVAVCDTVRDPEDDGGDIREFADFLRATKVPPRGPITDVDNKAGMEIFTKIGCNVCHVPTIVTAPVGRAVNGGTLTVPPALGNKTIHPFSDFLLHDVGTSDPIVQNGGPETYDYVRKPPLWGLRTRTQFMHDGASLNVSDAIRRHAGQAIRASALFRALADQDEKRLLVFLGSL